MLEHLHQQFCYSFHCSPTCVMWKNSPKMSEVSSHYLQRRVTRPCSSNFTVFFFFLPFLILAGRKLNTLIFWSLCPSTGIPSKKYSTLSSSPSDKIWNHFYYEANICCESPWQELELFSRDWLIDIVRKSTPISRVCSTHQPNFVLGSIRRGTLFFS